MLIFIIIHSQIAKYLCIFQLFNKKKLFSSLFKVILGQNSEKTEYGKLKLNGLNRDHPPVWAISDSASVGVNFQVIKVISTDLKSIFLRNCSYLRKFLNPNGGRNTKLLVKFRGFENSNEENLTRTYKELWFRASRISVVT